MKVICTKCKTTYDASISPVCTACGENIWTPAAPMTLKFSVDEAIKNGRAFCLRLETDVPIGIIKTMAGCLACGLRGQCMETNGLKEKEEFKSQNGKEDCNDIVL